jgi:hypothetical protein
VHLRQRAQAGIAEALLVQAQDVLEAQREEGQGRYERPGVVERAAGLQPAKERQAGSLPSAENTAMPATSVSRVASTGDR